MTSSAPSLLHRGTVFVLFNSLEDRVFMERNYTQRRSRKTHLVIVALEACGGRHLGGVQGPFEEGGCYGKRPGGMGQRRATAD